MYRHKIIQYIVDYVSQCLILQFQVLQQPSNVPDFTFKQNTEPSHMGFCSGVKCHFATILYRSMSPSWANTCYCWQKPTDLLPHIIGDIVEMKVELSMVTEKKRESIISLVY